MDIIDCGALKVVALKKCGSTTMRKAYGERQFSQRVKGWGPDRLLCYVRHPADRLVSAFNHFIARDTVHGPAYGPVLPFDEWLDWWLCSDKDSLDHHLRPQGYELWDAIAKAHPETQLGLGLLSACQATEAEVSKWLASSIGYGFRGHVRHPHKTWQYYYTQAQLRKVREAVPGCMWLWHVVRDDGFVVIGGPTKNLQRQLCRIKPASN